MPGPTPDKARLVIVSNRVPAPKDRTAQAGGLAVALADGVPPGSLWFGWSGRRSAEPAPPAVELGGQLAYATTDLTPSEYETYYQGFSNTALYPLLLFRVGLLRFRSEDYAGYRRVNARFAALLSAMLRADDRVWIHDYHLFTLPEELRARGFAGPVGFFLHTPFAPAALFAVLPRAVELLHGICAADVVGFQTAQDRLNFTEAAERMLGARREGEATLRLNGRVVRTVVTPVGIDATAFAATARRVQSDVATRRLAESLGDRALVLSADRMDHTKGLPERVTAIRHFFDQRPSWRRKVNFLQVAAESRPDVDEYQRLRRELDRMVGDLNGRAGEPDWTPLRYMSRPVRRNTLAGFHRLADVGLVTPLRDGMNLVAKEFVAAQDPEDPGVLVLSEFAGAAEAMKAALIVNPYDATSVADAVDIGLRMDLEERQARHRTLLDTVRQQSARQFCADFLAALEEVRRPAPTVLSGEVGMIRARVGILGAGNRGATAYGRYMLRRPDLAEVVALADIRPDRLAAAAAEHGVAPEHLYADWTELLRRESELDAVIIALPDRLHHAAAMAAMRKVPAILLEKPICASPAELRAVRAAARRYGANVTVAHVLRYTPFFLRIRELLAQGAIGTLQTVRHTEQIGYWHFAHSYVRGNWRREADASPMILSKACHDLDILRWLVDAPCVHVESTGRLGHFTLANAPEGSTEKCDQGCAVERVCPYSALRIYLDRLPPANAWPHDVVSLDTTPVGIAAALHTGPYGRCVYRCDNDVMDHQSVTLRFANGVTATLNVSAFTRQNTRSIHLMGSHGELVGDFTAGTLSVLDFRVDNVRTNTLTVPPDAIHGGGDDQLMADFLGRVQEHKRRGSSPDALTSLEQSLESHEMAFAAERSRLAGERVVLARRGGMAMK